MFTICTSSFSKSIFDLGDLYFDKASDNKSIPIAAVTSILQGKQGYLWIGINGGLARYDGYHFDIFYDGFHELTELDQHYGKALWNAPDNKIWIGRLEEGLSVFDPATKKFTQYLHNESDSSSLSDNNVWSIVGDEHGNIYIGTDNGLDHINNQTGIISHINILGCSSVFKENDIRSLLLGTENYLWIGTTHGLCKVKLNKSGIYKNQLIGQNIVSFNGQDIRTIYESYDGVIWVGTRGNGVAWFLPNSAGVSRITYNPTNNKSLSDSWVNSIIQPSSNEIWLGTANGIDVIDNKSREVVKHIKNDPTIKSSISSDYIRTLSIDDSGIVWIGTWGGGLSYFNPANTAISRIHHSPYQTNYLSSSDIRSMAELKNGQIWIGTRKSGIDILDVKEGVIGGYRPEPKNSKTIADGYVKAIHQTKDLDVWVGTRNFGLYRYDPKRKTFQNYSVEEGLTNVAITTIFEANSKELWIGTYSGLSLVNLTTKKIQSFKHFKNSHLLNNKYINSLAYTQDGFLWIGTPTGLFTLSTTNKEIKEISVVDKSANRLASSYISSLLVDYKNNLWVATTQGIELLKQWDGNVALFESINAKVGAPRGYIGGNLLEDKQERIWMHTGYIDTKNWIFHNLESANGWDIGTKWLGSYTKTKNGILLYGGANGLLMIKPDKIKSWTYQPKMGINLIKVNNNPIILNSSNEIILQPNTKSISIEFSALDFSAPENNKYTYQLVGYDTKWIKTDAKNRRATYTNLPPGDYELRIKGSNRNGSWSPNERKLTIYQLPAWYQMWQSQILAIFFSTLVLLFFYKKRLGYLNRQRSILEEDASKIKDFSLAMQEFATLDDLLWCIANYIGERLGFQDCVIYLVDNESLIQKAAYGPKNPKEKLIYKKIEISIGQGIVGGVAKSGIAEIISDTTIDPRYISDQFSGKSELAVPISFEGKVIAVIDSESDFKNFYNIKDRDFLQIIASIASSKIISSKYHQYLEDRVADISLLGEIGRGLTTNLNVNQVCEQIHTALNTVLDAHTFSLYVSENEGIKSLFSIENNIINNEESVCFSLNDEYVPAVWCVNNERAIVVNTLEDWKLYIKEIPPIRGDNTITVVYQPLIVGNKVVGCFTVQSLEENAYSEDQLGMIKVLSSYIAIALSNAKGYTELKETLEELKDTQQQLIQSSKMASLGTMTAGVAHEINNPTNFTYAAVYMMKDEINEIKAFLKQLAGGDNADPKVLSAFDEKFIKLIELIQTATEGTNRIKTIVEDLRSFARLDDAKKAKVQLSHLLTSTIHLVRTQYTDIDIESILIFDPEITCFPSKLNQVFMNIIVNACQAIATSQANDKNLDGRVIITTKEQGNQVVISFKDNGCGMDEKTQLRIFEPFYTTKDIGTGTGLGMAISFGIIEEHGGIININSAIGEGSVIEIHLPTFKL